MSKKHHLATASHLLEIYSIRLNMQLSGVTNPPDQIKQLTRTIVDRLKQLPPEEEIESIECESNSGSAIEMRVVGTDEIIATIEYPKDHN